MSTVPRTTAVYLAERLDAARDLYLLALALGERHDGPHSFGPMIQEARVHFAHVIEEAHLAGLDTGDIATMLKNGKDFAQSLRPEVWERLAQMLEQRPRTYEPPAEVSPGGAGVGGKTEVPPQTIGGKIEVPPQTII